MLSEHTVMTEALFVPLVVGTLTALVAALRASSLPLFGVAGLLLGLATLTRPVAQVLVPVVPLAILLVWRAWRPTLLRSAVALGAFGLVLLPWMVRSAVEHDSASVGSLGQSLVGRTARHDRGALTYYDPALHADEPPDRCGAPDPPAGRRQRLVGQGDPHPAAARARAEPAEADRLMRDLAIEAILRQPGYYVRGTLQRFFRMAGGSVERLRDARNIAERPASAGRTSRAATAPPATPAEDRAAPPLAVVLVWQPGYVGPVLPLLALLGTRGAAAAGLAAGRVLGLAALALLFISAALVGNVSRYRYPADPLLAVLAVGALAWIVSLVQRGSDAAPRQHATRAAGADAPGPDRRAQSRWSVLESASPPKILVEHLLEHRLVGRGSQEQRHRGVQLLSVDAAEDRSALRACDWATIPAHSLSRVRARDDPGTPSPRPATRSRTAGTWR